MSTQHRSIGGAVEDVAWNIDYCFVGDKLDNDMLEDENDDDKTKFKATILVTHYGHKKAFSAPHADKKGPTDGVVKWRTDRFEDSGYVGSPVIVKSDQEESIVALRRAIAVARHGDTIPINSPVRCSKANGRMERAIRTYQGQLKSLKHFSETGGQTTAHDFMRDVIMVGCLDSGRS